MSVPIRYRRSATVSQSGIRDFLFLFFNTSVLAVWSLLVGADVFLALLIILLSWLFFFCLKDFYGRVVLLAFAVAFCVLLVGREFLEVYCGVERESSFRSDINRHLYQSLLLSISSIWFVYYVSRSRRKVRKSTSALSPSPYESKVRFLSLLFFYSSSPFVVFVNLFVTLFISKMGYYSYYTDFSELLKGNSLLYVMSKLDIVADVAFCTFLATLPPKKKFKKPGVVYLIILLSSVGTGQRSTIILGLMLLVVFIAYMQKINPSEEWFSRRRVAMIAFLIPLVAIAGAYIGVKRFGEEHSFNPVDGIVGFFYEQGVSGYTVKRAYEMEKQIPKGSIYTLEFLYSGLPAIALGKPVLHGNTVEHAMKGNSFTHALGYTVLGPKYLSGAGTGSSYIAELYYDFGYLGIVLGSALYGWLLSLMSGISRSNSLLKRSILIVIFTRLLWACRASFTGFLSFLFSPVSLVTMSLIFLLSLVASTRMAPRQYRL